MSSGDRQPHRPLAGAPAGLHRLFALLRRRSASASLRSAVLAVLQPPFCGLCCRMSRKHDRNGFSEKFFRRTRSRKPRRHSEHWEHSRRSPARAERSIWSTSPGGLCRHASESRDVGRVSRRGLGRLLARRPALSGSTRCFPIAPQSLSCARQFELAKNAINRFNAIVRYALVSCRFVRGELA